jgi:hypothetical protein
MAGRPGNPVASMSVNNFERRTHSSIVASAVSAQQAVVDVAIDFEIDIAYPGRVGSATRVPQLPGQGAMAVGHGVRVT